MFDEYNDDDDGHFYAASNGELEGVRCPALLKGDRYRLLGRLLTLLLVLPSKFGWLAPSCSCDELVDLVWWCTESGESKHVKQRSMQNIKEI